MHGYYRDRTEPAELEQQLRLYAGGAISPRADGSPATAAATTLDEVTDPSELEPSALTAPEPQSSEKKEQTAEEQTAEEARVKELDRVVASARESVVAARIARLEEQQRAAATEPARGSAATPGGGFGETSVAGPPVEARAFGSPPPEANLAGPPERELGLGGAPEGETAEPAFEERLAQIRQIQELLRDIPIEQRSRILRKLESEGARDAVGEDTWSQLVTRESPD